YSLDACDTDRGLNPAFHDRRRDLSVFRYRDRHFSGDPGAVDAAVGTVVHAGLPANEYAFRQQYAPGEYAAMAGDRDGSVAIDPFRAVCAVDPLPRRGPRRGLAAIPRSRRSRRVVFW